MPAGTRETILHAARDVLKQSGYRGTSMRKIARHAGITHAAIYKHFSDKDSLLAALADHDFTQLIDTIAARLDTRDRPIGALATVLREFIIVGIENPELYEFLFQILPALPGKPTDAAEVARSRLLGRVVACVEAGDLSGDPQRLTAYLAIAAHGYISRALAKGPEGDVDEYVRLIVAGARFAVGVPT